MKTEQQDIEYKLTWRDEYLKWICGFANAQGGRLFVGVDDKGKVQGVENAKKLMEDIPNKVRDLLGIVVDVNLLTKSGKKYIEIVTDPYPYTISYHGHYYIRSGATNQELKGSALDRFMLRKQGKTWDGVPVPYLKAEDLDNATFDLFRKYAGRSGRMDATDLKDDNKGLLDKLRLVEGNYLKRAAALLFHPDPERFVTGAYVKIGYFKEKANLIFQDEVHGNLFQQVKGTLDLLTTKYLRALISYEGIQRIESLPMPREALREAVLNACVHKSYDSLTPIQIAVYDNRLEIWNSGVLPEDWTIADLLSPHRSRPYNPDIANTFFRAGEIEAWGRGIERIIEACKNEGYPSPEFKYEAGGVWTIFNFSEEYQKAVSDTVNVSVNDSVNVSVNDSVNSLPKQLRVLYEKIKNNPDITYGDLCKDLNITEMTIARQVAALKEWGLIEREGSDKTGRWIVKKSIANDSVNVSVNDSVNVSVNSLPKQLKIIYDRIKDNPDITYGDLRKDLNITDMTIARQIAALKDLGLIKREGSDKTGRWLVITKK